MNDSVIQELTAQLDSAIPREGAAVRLSAVIEHPDEEASQFTVVANRAGYLRLGIASLQAAFAPYAANDRELSDAILTDAGDLFLDAATVRFERTEHLSPYRAEDVPTDPPRVITAILGGLSIAVLMLVFRAALA